MWFMGEQVRFRSHSFRLVAMHLRRAAAEAHFDRRTLLTGVENECRGLAVDDARAALERCASGTQPDRVSFMVFNFS
jgi:hypothetical protein